MNTDTNQLAPLKALLTQAQEKLKQCTYAYKGLRTFRGNVSWIAISTEQLQQAATALREHANDLVEFATNLDTTYRDITEQLELTDLDGHR